MSWSSKISSIMEEDDIDIPTIKQGNPKDNQVPTFQDTLNNYDQLLFNREGSLKPDRYSLIDEVKEGDIGGELNQNIDQFFQNKWEGLGPENQDLILQGINTIQKGKELTKSNWKKYPVESSLWHAIDFIGAVAGPIYQAGTTVTANVGERGFGINRELIEKANTINQIRTGKVFPFLPNRIPGVNLRPKDIGISSKIEKITPLPPKDTKRMFNITKDIEEITSAPSSYLRKVSAIYKHHEGGISWKQAMAMAKLPKKSSSIHLYKDSEVSIKKGGLLDPDRQEPTEMYSTGVDPVDPKQLDFFETESAISKNLPEFITYPMARDMPAYSKEVPAGYFDYHKMRNWFYASESQGRKAIEAGMTPVVPGTQRSRGISFSGLARAQLPKLRRHFGPILKALKIDVAESASIHHIAALKATYGILHKVQVDSPLFREVYDALLEHIPGLGNMEGNLVPVIGMTKGKKQVSTPHNIVHRFYANTIGESGELFFTPEVLQGMAASDSYRIEKAHELGRIIARSEKIVKDAQQIWRISFSQEKINFNEIVNRLSELDELGYSKLADIEYQTPALSEMIIDIVRDIKVEKDQLKRLTPQSEDFSDVGKANVIKDATLEEERQRLERIRKNKSKHKPKPGQFSFGFLDDIFP